MAEVGAGTPAGDAILREVADRIGARLEVISAQLVKEVQAQIPEYARPLDPTYARTVRLGVEAALRHFLDLLAPGRFGAARDGAEDWRSLFQAIGAGEMHEGRSL